MTKPVFLLSPARCDGERAKMLVRSRGALGEALRSRDGAPLGDVFASSYIPVAGAIRHGKRPPRLPRLR